MKKLGLNKKSMLFIAVSLFMFGFVGPIITFANGPAPINLLSTSNFVVLSKTGITDTGSHTTKIIGNIGSSPITSAAMNGVFCSEITGKIYGVDAAYVGSGTETCFAGTPPSSNKTLVDNAVLDMGTAYSDALSRTNPTATELGAGNIGGMTLTPGLYKWSTDVTIPTSVTLFGGANDVWIFQITGNLNIASAGSIPSGVKVILSGGAQASNIFWQVGGLTGATLGTYSTFNGNILSAKQVIIQTGVVFDGRALAQTEVTLDSNIVSIPVYSPSSEIFGTFGGGASSTGGSSGTTSGGGSSVITGNFGGGNSVTGTVSGGSSGGGGGSVLASALPVGQVLGATTERVPISSSGVSGGTAGGDLASATTITPGSVPFDSNSLNTNQLAAAAGASGVSLGAWYWWVIILLLLLVLGYYQYRRYEISQNKRKVSIK